MRKQLVLQHAKYLNEIVFAGMSPINRIKILTTACWQVIKKEVKWKASVLLHSFKDR